MKLRTRYSFFILGLTTGSLLILSISLILLFENASAELNRLNVNDLKAELTERMLNRSQTISRQFAKNLARPLYNYDYETILDLTNVTLANDEVETIHIFDLKNNYFGHSEGIADIFVSTEQVDKQLLQTVKRGMTYKEPSEDQLFIAQPILVENRVIGGVEMLFSQTDVINEIKALGDKATERRIHKIFEFLNIALGITIALTIAVISVGDHIAKRLVHPIAKLVKFANDIGQGRYREHLSIKADDEIVALANTMNQMVANLEERSLRIQHLAYHDSLTDLPNRLFFSEILERWIDISYSHKKSFCLMFMDLDGFKRVNDTYGHELGDELIHHVSSRIKAQLSSVIQEDSDRQKPFLARLGGDEFVCVLEISSPAEAAHNATALIKMISQPYHILNFDIYISCSIGVAIYPDDGNTGSNLMKRADIAMYSAKNAGKNDFHFFSHEMDQQAHDRVALENELRMALSHNELGVWYQPLVNLKDNNICGVEALVRWKNPVRGFVGPDIFIPIAEESGLILPIGDWIIETICHQLSEWEPHLKDDFHVAINLSPIQIRHSALEKTLLKAISSHRIKNDRIHIEITETALVENEAATLRTLSQLNQAGIKIWLDDFGTGFSSLSHLKQFPVSGVKIDRSFVADLEQDVDDRALISAMIVLANAMTLDVIAEGIETEAQCLLLNELQCPKGQGYFYSRPLPGDQLLDLYRWWPGK
ncbi:putative bifunctional diguanylate cyclase/phosphodiesterase [Gynuella sunshinyii]|uniref:Putative signal transduction protein containing a membrane domain, an EAL and a GGDEF domain n=1 Tax=Gynuella sunshinyii YC6258 TaxID=1445510 RepID=A0A0C5V3C5_9GAMM|nr:EAL domain-containing protein [Gynuella sunshinyii]AJQ94035.1 putative signal transduction protein containing a membrane domain, an EAL and a GGDEF domain [Gynuella sunshinyii YC6258]